MSGSISARTQLRRHPERGTHDRTTIDTILDEAYFCHVAFDDDGPVVVPTIHVRVGDQLIFHGSPASRMMRTLASGAPMSAAVTIFDGLVVARSVFNNSMNYRSVVVFGQGVLIDDPEAKLEAMRVFTEKVLPGRWDDSRQPSEKEFRGTLMVGVEITEASAKTRSGPPVDEDEDYDLPHWAGVIPYRLRASEPEPDPRLHPGVELPPYLRP